MFVDIPGDVPHEIGHDLGRGHAPCNPGACSPPPANVDFNHPQYGNFPAGSIGVVGFDPTSDTTFDPAGTFDFMAYRFPQWVSAYTYNGLRGSDFGSTGGGGGLPGASPHLIGGALIDTLFLGLVITRDRVVTRRPSFHFPAPLYGNCGCEEQFTVEFQDAERNGLDCSPVFPDCAAGCQCWPKAFLNDIPYPSGARWFVVWEGDRKLYEEAIPDPPKVKIEGSKQKKKGVQLQWTASEDALWYLVQWLDSDDWRGISPRQSKTSILIPAALFIDSPALSVRVLATSGIATGISETTVRFDNYKASDPTIALRGVSIEQHLPATLPDALEAVVRDSGGRPLSGDEIAWFADSGVRIGSGPWVDLRVLDVGEHELRAVVRRLGGHAIMSSWIVERTPTQFLLKEVVPAPELDEPEEEQPHPHPPGS